MAREKFRLKRAITRRRGRLLSRKEEEGFLRRLRSSPSFAMPRSLSSFSPQLESSSSMVALDIFSVFMLDYDGALIFCILISYIYIYIYSASNVAAHRITVTSPHQSLNTDTCWRSWIGVWRREEIQRLKGRETNITYKEAFSTATENLEKG
ncbi:uncharacterized protein LOC122092803 isoform X2 [Macadamia integrifolia]|uniref:uncharacterized protein LOC122092803 isoform X2 n=1 Tax=Macadamia integrifolia TaxID=60698 RepID=UPI001C52A2C7|nr:uncharacterized protein LOC122092803 isoform X2 [Macadamia integrifolia]